jgi:hypothetical protein
LRTDLQNAQRTIIYPYKNDLIKKDGSHLKVTPELTSGKFYAIIMIT